MFEKFSYMILVNVQSQQESDGAAPKSLVVSLVSTLVKVFVARADARAATLSGRLSNPRLRLTVQTAHQMVRTRKRASTSGSATCARGRPQVSACASSRPDDLNFFSFRVAPHGCVNRHQNPRASAGFSATPPASTPQPEGQERAHFARAAFDCLSRACSPACGAGAVRELIICVMHDSVHKPVGLLSR